MALIGDIGTRFGCRGGSAGLWFGEGRVAQGGRRLQRIGLPHLGTVLTDRLPKGLYARSILIVVLPILILQAVVAYVFMERHWQMVTRRLSDARDARHRRHHRGHRDLSAGRALLRNHPHRRRDLRADHLGAAAGPAPGGGAAAVLLAARLDAVARDPPARSTDPSGSTRVGNSDMVEIRIELERPRAQGLRAAQPRLRLELPDLPVLDGRRLAGADRRSRSSSCATRSSRS